MQREGISVKRAERRSLIRRRGLVRSVAITSLALAMAIAMSLAPGIEARQAPRHFLWKVTSGSGAAAHLLGSIHVLTKDFYPLPPAIEEAFAASTVLVEEVDVDEMSNPVTMLSLVGKAMLPDGQTLDREISPETWAAVRARAETGGVPLLVLQRMKPWMAAVTLATAELSKAGFESDHGIDKHFFDRARASGMAFRALETVGYQFDRLDGLPAALQESALTAVLADIDAQVANVRTMAEAWRRGDTDTMSGLLTEGFKESPDVYERLLAERNRNWIPHIDTCLAGSERCFIVVGAAHLVGPDSVVVLLRKAGYTVEQL